MRTVGVFVGGRGTRMGGVAKGLLRLADGTTILDRTIALARGIGAEVVLVGRSDAYAGFALPMLHDVRGEGPLAGLVALMEHRPGGEVIALACDMPHVTDKLLGRLAGTANTAPVLAPRRGNRWEPFFARYDAPRCIGAAKDRLARGSLSLQGLLDAVGAEPLPLLPGEDTLLDDWDCPEDIA